jgi:hypothetical protein
MSESAEDEIGRLYELPPAEFTSARDELAKRLRKGGDRDAADSVKRLKKPSAAAWAINQAARHGADEVEQLLEAGAVLRKAHAAAMGGKGAGGLRGAAEEEREAVAEVSKLAEAALREAGQANDANVERVRDTLHAVAADDALRAELEAGRVTTHRAATGLGPFALGGETPTAPAPRARTKEPAGQKTKKPDKKAEERARREAERAAEEERERQEQEKALQRELREAKAALARASKRLDNAERAAERARAAAERAAEELQARETSLVEARGDAEEASAAADDAERRLESVQG